MTPDQEKKMALSLADYSKPEMTDLAIGLQNTIDTHVAEQRSRQSAVDQSARQNEALVKENDRLEALTKGIASIDNDEVERLRARNKELDDINAGLQRTIVKLSS